MKKTILSFLCLSMTFLSAPLLSDDDINQYKEDSEALWRRNSGSEDGAFSATSVSMLGWGVGLTAVIAILASVLGTSSD